MESANLGHEILETVTGQHIEFNETPIQINPPFQPCWGEKEACIIDTEISDLNTARSALSPIIVPSGGGTFGSHPMVTRFFEVYLIHALHFQGIKKSGTFPSFLHT